ncbi:MAG: PAS domain-containing protein [Bacillota bacterium]
MAMRLFAYRRPLALALLMAAGLLGNYLRLPFFFGIDYLFGSIATLIIIRLFGVAWGTVSAFLISTYTYFLWGHSAALAIFVLEALVVGLLAARAPRTSLLILDGGFWVLLGIPLVWLSYNSLVGVDAVGTTLIALKQAVNGFSNALVAVLLVTHLPLQRWLLGDDQKELIPIRETLFNTLVAFLILPALILTVLASRHEVSVIRAEVETLLKGETTHVTGSLERWWNKRLGALEALAATRQPLQPSAALDEHVRSILSASVDFLSLSLVTPEGTVAAAARPGSDLPVDLEAVRAARESRMPVISYPSSATPAVLTISQPIWRENRVVGVAQGTLDLTFVRELVTFSSMHYPLHLSVLTAGGEVVVTSRTELTPLAPFRQTGEIIHLGEDHYQRFPEDESVAVNRWRDAHEVMEAAISGGSGWRLVAEVPLAPFRIRLYRVYIERLMLVGGLTFLALFLSNLISRWVTRPLVELTTLARYLPQRLQGGEEITWPSSPIIEMNSLATDIRRMATTLRELLDEIGRESKQQRALISAAIEATDVPVIITDSAERIVYVNPPFLQEYGYTPDEILGRRPAFLQGPLSDQRALEQVRQAVRLGQRITVRLVNYRKDGSAVPTELILSPLKDDEGRVTHFVGIQRSLAEAGLGTGRWEVEPAVPDQRAALTPGGALVLRSSEPTAPPSGHILLLVDPSAAERAKAALQAAGFQAAGFQAEVVTHPDQAWDALTAAPYEAVLLDQALAGGGEEFAQELRQSLRFNHLPVVLLNTGTEACGVTPEVLQRLRESLSCGTVVSASRSSASRSGESPTRQV